MKPFAPTHELFDENGRSCGLYLKTEDCWTDAFAWFQGERPCLIDEWGWSAKPLTPEFRRHYAESHGRDGSSCGPGCALIAPTYLVCEWPEDNTTDGEAWYREQTWGCAPHDFKGGK